jgi:hypothetical protein
MNLLFIGSDRMEVLEFMFELSFPKCEHKLQLTARSKTGAEKTAKHLIEQYNGVCSSCYKESLNN